MTASASALRDALLFVAPVSVEKVPASQGVHAEAPAPLKVPAPQGWHTLLLVAPAVAPNLRAKRAEAPILGSFCKCVEGFCLHVDC